MESHRKKAKNSGGGDSSSSAAAAAASGSVTIELVEQTLHLDEMSAHHGNATVKVGSAAVGTIEFTFIEPDPRQGNWLSQCDAVSQDLQDVSCRFFDADGDIVCGDVLAADDRTWESDGNALIYIDSLRIDEAHRSGSDTTRVGYQALNALFALPQLAGRWKLAVYIPEAAAVLTAAQRAVYDAEMVRGRNNSLAQMMGKPEISAPSGQAQLNLEELAKVDARQFIRTGFKQKKKDAAGATCLYFFITQHMLESTQAGRPMDHAAACATAVVGKAPPARPPPAGLDAELLLTFSRCCASAGSCSAPAAGQWAECDALVRRGANVDGACLLHAAAAHTSAAGVRYALSKGADANAVDMGGDTPLGIAAGSTPGNAPAGLLCVQALLGAGANTRAMDVNGRTPHGKFLRGQEDVDQFSVALLSADVRRQLAARHAMELAMTERLLK